MIKHPGLFIKFIQLGAEDRSHLDTFILGPSPLNAEVIYASYLQMPYLRIGENIANALSPGSGVIY